MVLQTIPRYIVWMHTICLKTMTVMLTSHVTPLQTFQTFSLKKIILF